jgi:tetratricopeptide (TPR) repeat protein
MQDVSLASAGFRAVAADIAWMETLQYAASGIPALVDAPGKPYGHVLSMCRRVVRLDPAFHRAYLYGAGILAWFRLVDRSDEAIDLLKEGIRRDPGQPMYRVYLAAIAFQRKGDDARMLALLEESFDDPQTPSTMKAILANLYKTRGDFPHALSLWRRVLENPRDESEHGRAREQIEDLKRRIGAAKK